jgi:DNA-binding NtrC family response regulator
VAGNLAAAERLLSRDATDAIIFEPGLRGLQGQPLLGRLRTLAATVPVIIVSGYPLGRWFNGDVREHIFAYFPKPFDIWELQATVRKCVSIHARRQYVCR